MAGIYIHIPFCRKACHYCNFHFSTSLKLTDDFFDALAQEIDLQKDYLQHQPVGTVYFGGGTPSLAAPRQLKHALERLRNGFIIEDGAEITLEANPDDIDPSALNNWQALGFNRLSIGVQSFRNEDLGWMNRVHDAGNAVDSIKLAQDAGFGNISIDLIYGVPGMDDEAWKQNIQTAIDLGIPHLSCYALTVEPGTALDKMIMQHKTEPVDPNLAAQHFDILVEMLANNRFEQYEISNFAQPGFRSRHNTAYWKGVHYLGLGPSAHSFNGTSRQWNVANNVKYIRSVNNGIVPFEQEVLTPVQQLNEYIMTSLRTVEGTDINYIEAQFGKAQRDDIFSRAGKYINDGRMQLQGDQLTLTAKGKFFADGIAADLFIESHRT